MSNLCVEIIESIKKLIQHCSFQKYNESEVNREVYFTKEVAFFNYNFMMSLKKKDYSKYLSIAYEAKTGKKLNLKNPKSINEKIQWLKIYDNIPQKSDLTDKVLVRDYVREKIGEKYLKPALWIGERFEDIPFSDLPESFIIKANHGCRWHAIIKNKSVFLKEMGLYNSVKNHFDGWLQQTFFGFSDFEAQYLTIKPKIIVESLMRTNINKPSKEFWVWCINSVPYTDNEEFKEEALMLSKKLSEGFKFVRIDWMIYDNRLYFMEMTFTPLSGYIPQDMLEQEFYKNLSEKFILK